MSMVKRLKILVLAAICTIGLGGANSFADCVAHAQRCNASCSLSTPPGGSVICVNGFTWALCTSYDASGNVVTTVQDICYPWPLVI